MVSKPRWLYAYTLLEGWAAESTRPVSYGQLATVLRIVQGKGCHRRHIAGMLKKVNDQCIATGEPDLTAFVVGAKTELPSSGWAGWSRGDDPAKARAEAHEFFRVKVWGK